jgi:hypothetical protein
MGIFGYHLPSILAAVIAFVAVLAAFARFDKQQSDDTRHFARDWLLGLKVDNRKWKQFFEELFARFFGPRHLSWKCASRSFLLSVVLLIAIYALRKVTWDWPKFRGFNDPFFSTTAVALIGAVIVNYLSLWKTRFLLTRVGSLRNAFVAAAIVIGDFLATTVIFAAFYYLVFIDLFIPLFVHFQCPDCDREITFIRLLMGHEQRLPFRYLYSAALLTSAWLWVYLIVAYGMRVVNSFPSLLKATSKIMDFQEHPARTIGYVAATMSAVIVWIAQQYSVEGGG